MPSSNYLPLGGALASLNGSSTNVNGPKVIEVYIRKGSDNRERWLSFTLPDVGAATVEMQSVLLTAGVAIDGNQALWSVSRVRNMAKVNNILTDNPSDYEFSGVFGPGGFTLPEALAAEQSAVANLLKDSGFQTIFR